MSKWIRQAVVTLGAALMLIAVPARAATSPEELRFDALVKQVTDEMLVDPAAAADHARLGERTAAAIRDDRARGVALATAAWLQGEGAYWTGDLDRAAPLIARALRLVGAASPGIKLEGDALLTSGSIHGARSEVAEALTDFLRAHRIFATLHEQRSQAISLICMAMLYVDAKDYATARRYLDEALEAFPADPGLALSIYNSRGIINQEQGLHAQANADFQRALGYAKIKNSTDTQVKFLRNIARNQLYANQLGQADRSIAAARALPASSHDNALQLDAVAAQAALQHGRAVEAERLIDRAFAGVDLDKTDLSLRDAHQTAVSVYRARHRSDLALAHLQALKRLDDQATRLATQTSTALMAARFNSANQDAKIVQLRDAARLRQAQEEVQRARNERTLLLGISGATAVVIVLLLIGITTIRRSRDQVRSANDDLATTNTALGKALAAKTEFLATTSHEIRTPLNGILGMTQVMLADTALTSATRERLTVVHGAGVAMRSLVDDILDAAKMETGNLGLEAAPFDLRATLTDASRIWSEQARDKGLTFTLDLDRCPARVEGDSARVRQIASNLLSNALKFTAAGSVSLVAEQAPGGIRLAVTDTGIGIAPAQHEAVFESFRQADTSTTRQFGGTGLGLSIVRNLARAMGGEVSVASEAGAGAAFTVLLPLPVLAEVPTAAVAAPADTLLIVDRNPIARAMLRTLFAPHVGAVVFAGSADEIVAAMAGGDVSRVLIDEATARAGGDPTAFVATAVRAATDVPVTLLWTQSDDSEVTELSSLGVRSIIAKPITGAALVKAFLDREVVQPPQTALVSQAA